MKLRGLFTTVALVSALFIAVPANAQNQAEDLFSATSVSQITISLSNKLANQLVSKPKTGVPATFDISNAAGTLHFTNLPIDMHLKGTSTLLQNPNIFTNRPSMRVKFKLDGKIKLPFLGTLKSLTLNSMTQDASKIHEFSSYKLYNAMNVPAPRVGYAHIKLKVGTRTYDKGLFAIIEPYDEKFLENHFPTGTQHLYENCKHFTDITRPGATSGGETCTATSLFEPKVGWKKNPNKLDLKSLVAVQKLSKNSDWWLGMQRYTDRSELIRMWAVDNFVGAWDSYSGAIINNYFLRSDSMGVFSMLPFGTDETFEYNFKMDALGIGYPLIYSNFKIQTKGRGSMFMRCLRYRPCLNEYLDDLDATKKAAKKIDLVGQMKQVSKLVSNVSGGGSPGMQQFAQNWIGRKGAEVSSLLKKYNR
jgi:spore coat protein CotH